MSTSHTAQSDPGNVLAFPARIPPAASIVNHTRGALNLELGARGQFCSVLYVARQLRLEAVDIRTVVAHIRAHIAATGFPAPATSRLRHGVPLAGAGAVTPKSEWLRASVDAWAAERDARASGALAGAIGHDRAARVDATLAARFAGQDAGE